MWEEQGADPSLFRTGGRSYGHTAASGKHGRSDRSASRKQSPSWAASLIGPGSLRASVDALAAQHAQIAQQNRYAAQLLAALCHSVCSDADVNGLRWLALLDHAHACSF